MKATELRIGNFIQVNNDPCVEVGYGIITDLYQQQKGVESNYLTTLNFKPIPLTEKWLLKLGFTQDPEDHWSMILKLNKDSLYLSTSFTRTHVTVFDGRNLSTGVHVNFVHQLQNLYFALTGEELTVK